MRIAVVGGGPAGLRAAEVAALAGAQVTLFDAKPSVGRKFLVAGRGGLNITKGENPDAFATHYEGLEPHWWQQVIADFGPEATREWAADLGIETFMASTGRVYPREMKAAPLLRRWVHRLKELGVTFAMRHRWTGLRRGESLELEFETQIFRADAAILALGGGSWPETGSDGAWTAILENLGVAVVPLQPANCGWEANWTPEFLKVAEGHPLKNITARANGCEAAGELLISRYGLEGGAIYQLGPALRAMPAPSLEVDLKPGVTLERLIAKMGPAKRNLIAEARNRWKLTEAAAAILEAAGNTESVPALARSAKRLTIPLIGPRPIAEAISSAGGVRWDEIDENLMLRKIPGVFVAGEMIDWEAPTGGYLMQGCFAMATRAAKAAAGQPLA